MKKAFRSVLTVSCFTIFMVGASALSFVILPYITLTRRDPIRRRHSFSAAVRNSWRFFIGIMEFFRLIKVNVHSEEGVSPKDFKGAIVVANHPSLIDVVILASIVPSPICVAKVGLAKLFFLRPILKNFCITNDAAADEFIGECRKALEAGHNVIIFPEGTRSVPGEKAKYHRGFAYVAMDAGAEIMPVRISVSKQILGRHQKFYDVTDKLVDYDIQFKKALLPVDKELSTAATVRMITENLKLTIE
jgi:1-acyl-sn-glycerol-3-phosphate acyltransferase